MSRERKYRGWDKEAKKFHYFSGIFNKQPYIETSTFAQYESCPKYVELDITDWTGLKDKNGVSIFEGDICHSGDAENVGKIEFHNGAFCWTDGACYWNLAVDWRGQLLDAKIDIEIDLVVIGNIYENPLEQANE